MQSFIEISYFLKNLFVAFFQLHVSVLMVTSISSLISDKFEIANILTKSDTQIGSAYMIGNSGNVKEFFMNPKYFC